MGKKPLDKLHLYGILFMLFIKVHLIFTNEKANPEKLGDARLPSESKSLGKAGLLAERIRRAGKATGLIDEKKIAGLPNTQLGFFI